MRKLKLDLDTLVVESFAAAAPAHAQGTVHGAAAAKTDVNVDRGSWIDACPSRLGTCDFTCADTCAITCKQGCNGI